MSPRRVQLLLTSAALLVTGCGVADPYDPPPQAAPPTAAAPAPSEGPGGHDHEAEGRRAPRPLPAVAEFAPADARELVRRFALAYSNWSWKNLEQSSRARLALAADELREQLRAELEASRSDTTLTRDELQNRGEVLAVDVQRRRRGAVAYAVVRETSATKGLEPIGSTFVRVYRAELGRRGARLALVAWEPVL